MKTSCITVDSTVNTHRMNSRPPAIFKNLCALAVFFATAVTTFADTSVATDPVGFMTYTMAGAQDASTPTTTALCVPLQDPQTGTGAITGTITSVASDTISNSGASWTPGAFAVTGSPCFVRIKSGAAKGRTLLITGNTATDLTVNNQGIDLSIAGIAVNTDTYQIIAGDTLFSLFGSSTLPGTSDATADNVLYYNGSSWQTFYYNSTNNRWQQKGVSLNANNFVLRPDSGLLFLRRDTTSLTFSITGTVPTTDLGYVVNNVGSTFLANGFPSDTKLSVVGFNSLPNWAGSTDGSSADLVMFWNGSSWQRFYYNTINNRWQQVGLSLSANNFAIPAGKPVMISRTGVNTGYAIFQHTIPYLLN